MPGSSRWSIRSGFPNKPLYACLLSQNMLNASPISFFLIWSFEKYLARGTDQAPHYVIFSTSLLSHPS
jgi:hypothetical protein